MPEEKLIFEDVAKTINNEAGVTNGENGTVIVSHTELVTLLNNCMEF